MGWTDAERGAWREKRAVRKAGRLARQRENRATWAERGLERLAEKILMREWKKALHDLDQLRVTVVKLVDKEKG